MRQQIDIISVGSTGWLELGSSLQVERTHKALAYANGWWQTIQFFHRDGKVYKATDVRPERPIGSITRFLARTIYNPRMRFIYGYEPVQNYTIRQLHTALTKAIQADDDVLTQFCDGKKISDLLMGTKTFDEVIAVLKKANCGYAA